MTDPTDIAGLDAEQTRERDEAKAKRLQEEADLKWLMSHASGRRFAARLLEQTALLRTSFHTSGSLMALNEGRKQLGYWLQGELLEVDPQGYIRLLKEYMK